MMQGKNVTTMVLVNQLREYMKDKEKATLNQITDLLFGDVMPEYKQKARYIINVFRKIEQANGRYFYSIDRWYQYLNADNYVRCAEDRKAEVKARMLSLQNLVMHGIKEYPELKKDLAEVLGEIQLNLLTQNNETI